MSQRHSQSEFGAALFNAQAPVPKGIINPNQSPASKRFNIYRNNVITSLIGAMQDGFPVTQKIVGEAFFKEMARIYVRERPPSSPLMIYYGEDFSAFIDKFEPAKALPYLADIAKVEYLKRLSYFARDFQPLPEGWLSALGDDSHVTLAPHVKTLASRFPIASIWAKQHGADIHITMQAEEILITRSGHEVLVTKSPKGTDQLAQNLHEKSLSKAIEGLPEDADIPAAIALLLPHVEHHY